MPTIKLSDKSVEILENYHWNGNIRQLKNIAEQLSVLEKERLILDETLLRYLPNNGQNNLPALISKDEGSSFNSEREILYKVLFDMKADLNDLKKLTLELMQTKNLSDFKKNNEKLIQKVYDEGSKDIEKKNVEILSIDHKEKYDFIEEIKEIESLSIHYKELELIKKSLEKHKGKRKLAATELGISERTLYRKIKQFNL
jgi:transcriptional regulator with PAS, ATPase and Fis domain